MRKISILGCGIAAFFLIVPTASFANQSGLAGMHAQRVMKGRVCFTDHTHVGTGSAARTKRQAVASAAQDWASFTAFEYGSSWASWRASTGKKKICQRGAGKWTCEVHARPCLIGKRRRSRQARR